MLCIPIFQYVSIIFLYFSLLKEAQPILSKRYVEMGGETVEQAGEEEDDSECEEDDDHKLLSRYGIWLLIDLCPADGDIPLVSSTIKSRKVHFDCGVARKMSL